MGRKTITADEAARNVDSNDTVTISGLGNVLCPEQILSALEERFQRTDKPTDLTVFTPIRAGNEGSGLEHLAHKPLLDRLITGSFNTSTQPGISELTQENEIEAYSFPMGVSFDLLSQIAAGRPGILTDVGLETYVDPRNEGATYNETTTEDLIEVRTVDGEEYLFYRTFPVDVAIIRGTTADSEGNLSLEREPNDLGVLDMAMAAHNSGGTVIAQVERMTTRGRRDPRNIEVPGTLVDHVVVNPDQSQILEQKRYDPALTGEIRDPDAGGDIESVLPARKQIILRRALLEIEADHLINLGVGMPVFLPDLCRLEGVFDEVTFTTEHGIFGGVPNPDDFGTHQNPETILKSPDIFRLYQGGGLDITFLGLAQLDAERNVNNSNFAGTLRGPGGFIDITNRTDKIVLCGSLTAGGLKVERQDGEVTIVEEGRHQKFVREVEEITLNGGAVVEKGSTVTVITERGVFKFTSDGVHLTEIAPGIDVNADVHERIAFNVEVVDDLSTFDPRVVQTGPMDVAL